MFNQVQMNTVELRKALRNDPEFFIQFFLGDELTFPVPDFHVETFTLMTSIDVLQLCFALPRDHAKTTLAKLACVWHLLFTDYQFIIYLSNVHAIAVPATNDIITFLECDNFRAAFGNVEFEVKRDGEGFYIFTISVPGVDGTLKQKLCIIKALGAGQSVRGINIKHRRPQLAVVDDLEDTDNIATEDLFMKLKRWFYGTFRKCLDKRGHKIIQIGNMISNKCLLKEHCESKYWFSRRMGCLLANGKPLWPDAWTVDALKENFREYVNAGMMDIWFAEMMNLPLGSGRGLIKPQDIHYRPGVNEGEIEYGFITVDLAISDKTWAHKTAVAVHGWVGDAWQVVELESGTGIDPIDLFWMITDMCFRWHICYVGIEAVAFQAALKKIYNWLLKANNIEGIEFVDVFAQSRKVQRLAGWAAMIKAKEWYLTEGDYTLTTQLLEFDPKKRDGNDDDEIDACAYGPQMVDYYLYDIQAKVTHIAHAQVVSGYDVARI